MRPEQRPREEEADERRLPEAMEDLGRDERGEEHEDERSEETGGA